MNEDTYEVSPKGNNTAKFTYTCTVCNSQWVPKKKTNKPQRCPRCKSKMWDRSYKHICSHCNHEWVSTNSNPEKCPNCQSHNWLDSENSVQFKIIPDISCSSKPAILRRYDSGFGCVQISIELGITFSEVYEIILDSLHDKDIRI